MHFFIVSSFLLIFAGCTAASLNPEWVQGAPDRQNGVLLYTEPGLDQITIRKASSKATVIEGKIRALLFPTVDSFDYKIVLYKNQAGYSESKRHKLPSVAHFHKLEKQLHIASDAPDFVWRHEMTHALLESVSENSPYWIHEGLADLMMSDFQPYPGQKNCGTIKMITHRLHLLPVVRKSVETVTGEINYHDRKQFMERLGLASFFMLYQWDKGTMSHDLDSYLNGEGPFVVWTENGVDEEEMSSFRAWLRTARPAQRIHGCFGAETIDKSVGRS